MNYISKLFYKVMYYTKLMTAERIVKTWKFGGQIGTGCRFLDDPFKIFGSEPYLVSLGDHVEITSGCRLITHDGGVWVFRNKTEYSDKDIVAPIRIGNNVFLGINTIVLPGVNIGDNVVIGAGSVVTRNIPSGSVYAGVPAKPVKTLDEYEKNIDIKGFPTKKYSFSEKRKYFEKNCPIWFKK